MATDEPAKETIPANELVRLRRIEQAAGNVLVVMEGNRSATVVLAAVAELRQALQPL
jgi:hypothetical protein